MNLMFSLIVWFELVLCTSRIKKCKEIQPRCWEGNAIHTGCLVNRKMNETIYSEISKFQGMKEETDSLKMCGDDWYPYSEALCSVEGSDDGDASQGDHKYPQVVIKAVLICTRGKYKRQNEHFSEMLHLYFPGPEVEMLDNSVSQSQEIKIWIYENWLYFVLSISVSVNAVLLVVVCCLCKRQQRQQPPVNETIRV